MGMIAILAAGIIAQAHNTLTPAEKDAGWQLLFNGKNMAGWNNYKSKGVSSGWVITDGVLRVADPGKAGDIATEKKFDWFELYVDFKLEKGQNSGIMFRVTDEGEAPWNSGPEVQIYDSQGQPGEQTGWLYNIYSSKVDAAKPVGQWNTFRIVVAPDKCFTEVNGVRYYEWKWDSKDFWERQKKTKFTEYPQYAKANSGRIAIQGDHGNVSFRNIKIRPIKAGRSGNGGIIP